MTFNTSCNVKCVYFFKMRSIFFLYYYQRDCFAIDQNLWQERFFDPLARDRRAQRERESLSCSKSEFSVREKRPERLSLGASLIWSGFLVYFLPRPLEIFYSNLSFFIDVFLDLFRFSIIFFYF